MGHSQEEVDMDRCMAVQTTLIVVVAEVILQPTAITSGSALVE